MNKQLFIKISGLLFGLLVMAIPVMGQTYTPFDFKHGEWVCGYDTKGGVFSSYGSYYIKEEVKFYCQGDTIINDTLYNKLYYKGVARYPDWARRELSGYYGAIRNDTLNRQVFWGNLLLYDFNLQVGDSIKSIFFNGGPILSIDSVLYCDKYHRRYNYKGADNYALYLIEGIGSIFGLFPHILGPNISGLACYSETDNPVCDTCNTPSSVEEMILETVKIFPNPANDVIRVTSSIPVSSVEILDLLGRQVYYDSNVDTYETDIKIRGTGIFIVKVEVQGLVVVKKIIKN